MSLSPRLTLQIAAPVLIGSLALLALGVGAAWYVHHLQTQTSELLTENLKSVHAAQGIVKSIREMRTIFTAFLIDLDWDRFEETMAPITERQTELRVWIREAQSQARTPKERDLLGKLDARDMEFNNEFNEILELRRKGRFVIPKLRRLVDTLLTTEILSFANEYLDLNQELVTEASELNVALANWIVVGLLILGTCGSLAGLLTGFGIARGVSSGLVQLSVPIRDAAGKLDEVVGPMTVSTGQSFEEMQGVLETMAEQVGTVVERLHESQKQALRAEQLAAVGQLAAGMAHELRNPLTSMKILVQSAAERSAGPGLSRRDIEVLGEEITRLEQLIAMFLDFARPPQLAPKALDLRDVVDRGVDLVSVLADQLNVEIDVAAPDEQVVVWADAGQLRQVLLNLLLNALDVLTEGGRIMVRLEVEGAADAHESQGEPQQRWARLAVADNGGGLPADLGDRIFEPFVSTKETGIGLGLSICRRIVEAHGGEIRAHSLPDRGAEFVVRLPLASEAAAAESGPMPAVAVEKLATY